MSAHQQTHSLMQQFGARGISLSFDDVNTLRRAQIVLHRWSEQECGESNDYASWSIERDWQTGVPYRCWYPHGGKIGNRFPQRTRIADREAGALRRVAEICERNGLQYYHQTDPRGCALYISTEPLGDSYTRGIAV